MLVGENDGGFLIRVIHETYRGFRRLFNESFFRVIHGSFSRISCFRVKSRDFSRFFDNFVGDFFPFGYYYDVRGMDILRMQPQVVRSCEFVRDEIVLNVVFPA